jgi:hypothetical protein
VALPYTDGYNGFVWKLNRDGSFGAVWHAASQDDLSRDVVVDSQGNVFSTGGFYNTGLFDTGTQLERQQNSTTGHSLIVLKTTQELGGVFGQLFDDLNNNGSWEAGEPAHPGIEVYVDANNSGVWDAGELSAITGTNGEYLIRHLAPGAHIVRQVLQEGWTQTYPVAGAAQTAVVGAGQSDAGVNFGATFGATFTLPGDIDGDGQVQVADFVILANNFGQLVVPATNGDIDGDGRVQFADFVILANNFGKFTAAALVVPEAADRFFEQEDLGSGAASEDAFFDQLPSEFLLWL